VNFNVGNGGDNYWFRKCSDKVVLVLREVKIVRLVIVTGMSGAGKSITLKMLEDMGYYCVDNLPILLLDKFVDLLETPNQELSKVALGIDIRSGEISELEKNVDKFEVLFLEATDEVLVKRYKETRRNHPLALEDRIDSGIRKERSLLAELKRKSDYILDTSSMLTRELRKELEEIFINNREFKNLFVNVLSFGFKYGIPNDADLVFDVRFLPNPYYIPELKNKTGNDKDVQDYVMSTDVSKQFLEKLVSMVKFLIPNYIQEGKSQLVIAIGCTGGKHRSVTFANKLHEALLNQGDYGIKVEHRDIPKDAIRKG